MPPTPLFRLGWILYLGGLGGLGVLSLLHRDFALDWQPVPSGVPHRAVLACVSGAILLGGAVGLLLPATQKWAALILAAFVTSWLFVLQVPRLINAPQEAVRWLGAGENMILVAGGWSLAATLADRSRLPPWTTRACVVAYALCLPAIGWSHFVYADFTAGMVPAWLPFRLGIAYFTGAAHVAAGIGILLGMAAGLAAFLEAAMLGCFLLLLHLPGVVAEPASRLQWTMLFVVCAYCGSAWILADVVRKISPGKRHALAGWFSDPG